MISDSKENDELRQLREENARLKDLLTKHGIQWKEPLPTTKKPSPSLETCSSHLSASERVALFRSLFRGRTDVYPLRWESTKGKSGYSPAMGLWTHWCWPAYLMEGNTSAVCRQA